MIESQFLTLVAGEDLLAKRRVKLSGATLVYADSGDRGIGVTEFAVSSGDDVTIRLDNGYGTMEMTANGAISAGEKVYAADDGKISATASHVCIGQALETGTLDGDILEILAYPAIYGDPDEIYVAPNGDDNADGSILNPVASLTAAFALVTTSRKTIRMAPGTYTEAAAAAWPTINGVKLIGAAGEWMVTIAAADTADEVITVAPGAQTSTWEMWIENIYIDHSVAGQDGINIVHTDVGKKLNVYLHNFGGDADSSSDKIITMTHGGDGNAIRVYWDGDNGGVEGQVYMDTEDAGDRLYITDVVLNGGIVSSADAVASNIRLIRCIVPHAGGASGGNGAQTITTVCCYSDNSGTYAALDTDELTGSHSEAIVA